MKAKAHEEAFLSTGGTASEGAEGFWDHDTTVLRLPGSPPSSTNDRRGVVDGTTQLDTHTPPYVLAETTVLPELPHYRPECESPQEWTSTAPTVVPVFPEPHNVPQDNMLWYYGYRFHDGTCVATSTMVPSSKGGGVLFEGRRSPTTMAPFLKGGGAAGVGSPNSSLLDGGSRSPPATQREAQYDSAPTRRDSARHSAGRLPLSSLVLNPRGPLNSSEDYTTTRTALAHPLVPTRGLSSCRPTRGVIGGETRSPARRGVYWRGNV